MLGSFGFLGRHEKVHWTDVSKLLTELLFLQPSLTVARRRGIVRPSFRTEKITGENKDASKWIEKYLGVGEWVMDQSVAIAGSSGFFERRR